VRTFLDVYKPRKTEGAKNFFLTRLVLKQCRKTRKSPNTIRFGALCEVFRCPVRGFQPVDIMFVIRHFAPTAFSCRFQKDLLI
jgi:hypothetical protein